MHLPQRWSIILRSVSITFPATACLEDIDPRAGQSFGRQWGLSATCPQGSRRMCCFRAAFAFSGPFTLTLCFLPVFSQPLFKSTGSLRSLSL